MKQYRIYTEWRREWSGEAERLTSRYYKGFTVLRATGYWEGQRERSMVIEILVDEGSERKRIDALAREIKAALRQDAVLVVEQDVDWELV